MTKPLTKNNSPSAIAKVVAVAEALTEQKRLSRIAQVTGLPVSTVYRILQELVTQGWVRDDEENVTRVRCVGAVVMDRRSEPIGAVSVSGLSFDMARAQVARLGPMVVRTAREVSAALGAKR